MCRPCLFSFALMSIFKGLPYCSNRDAGIFVLPNLLFNLPLTTSFFNSTDKNCSGCFGVWIEFSILWLIFMICLTYLTITVIHFEECLLLAIVPQYPAWHPIQSDLHKDLLSFPKKPLYCGRPKNKVNVCLFLVASKCRSKFLEVNEAGWNCANRRA